MFLELAQVNERFPSFEDWSQCFPCMTPGWHVIKTCYQVDFDAKKELYDKYMQHMTINGENSGSWLSCDHTFASASTNNVEFNQQCYYFAICYYR